MDRAQGAKGMIVDEERDEHHEERRPQQFGAAVSHGELISLAFR